MTEHYSNYIVLMSRNDSLDGATFFINNPIVLSFLGLAGIVALVSIIRQVIKIFRNANDDRYVEQKKGNIIVIFIAFVLIIIIPFLLAEIPTLLNTSSTHQNIIIDDEGHFNGVEYYEQENADSWQFMK